MYVLRMGPATGVLQALQECRARLCIKLFRDPLLYLGSFPTCSLRSTSRSGMYQFATRFATGLTVPPASALPVAMLCARAPPTMTRTSQPRATRTPVL